MLLPRFEPMHIHCALSRTSNGHTGFPLTLNHSPPEVHQKKAGCFSTRFFDTTFGAKPRKTPPFFKFLLNFRVLAQGLY